MKKTVVIVPVTESERGWGRQIDDYMVCLTHEDAIAFTKEFNSKNTEETVPDYYMIVEHEPQAKYINETEYQILCGSENKRMWLSSLEKEAEKSINGTTNELQMKTQDEIEIMLHLERARLKSETNPTEVKVLENRISILNWVLNK